VFWAAANSQRLGMQFVSSLSIIIYSWSFHRIIPQPDYLWAAMVDGGWSKLNMDMAIEQINVVLRLISSLNDKYSDGEL